MAESIEEAAALTQRIRNLPIYPIYENCAEKNSLTALQFMCIVDFYATKSNLYARINESQQPKLLGHLLQFRQFEKFNYYDYRVKRQYGNYVLQCKYCLLVGPCGCILTHMVINHNVHVGVVNCIFCGKEKLSTHIANKSLDKCFIGYFHRNNIEIDENLLRIVTDFYDMLKELCVTLNICTVRGKQYAGHGTKTKEILAKDYGGDILPEYEVRYMVSTSKRKRCIQSEGLRREYNRIMDILCGGNYVSRSKRNRRHNKSNESDVIVIDSDSGGDDNEVNRITRNSVSNSLLHSVIYQ